jgi:O-antigen/teichoic acid export membrane protein
MVAFFQGLAMFQMSSTLARFVPVYREQKQYNTMFGSIVLAFGFVVGLGTLIAAAVYTGLTSVGFKPTDDPQALRLLTLLLFLIPIQALDDLFTSLFAAFGSSRTILLRQSILAPGLRLLLILVLIKVGASVVFLTNGYLGISLLGVLLYVWMFAQMLYTQGWLKECHPREFSYPVRDILGFASPMMFSTLIWMLMESSGAVLLGYFKDSEAVASFRVVQPITQLNMFVTTAFTTLYTPMAAKLYARNDHDELSELYWRTAIWMTVLSFPVFVVTFSFARPITIGLYGIQYADAVPVTILLSLGYFVQTILGFNGITLKIFNQLRYVVGINIVAVVFNIALNLLLIPRWGALGAAIATAATMIVHNVLKQFGLWKYTGITLFDRRYVLTYIAIFAVPMALLGLQLFLPTSIWIALPVSAAASLLVLWGSRSILQVDTMFPELSRWPIMRTILRS